MLPDRFLQAEPLVDMIELHRPTIAAAVPTIWNDVLQYLHANPGRGYLVTEDGCCGGSAVPLAMMKEYEERYGVVIRQGWGMTETSPAGRAGNAAARRSPATTHWTLRAAAGDHSAESRSASSTTRVAVLPNDGKAVGEIEIRGPVDHGIVLPECRFGEVSTTAGCVPATSVTIDPQGFITLTDRAKDVIKSGGEWISSVELENAHHGTSRRAGGGCRRGARRALAGAATCRRRDQGRRVVHRQELRNHLCDKVARFWLPERWTFIDEVPKTSVGKFDKKHIRSLYADGVYDIVECRD